VPCSATHSCLRPALARSPTYAALAKRNATAAARSAAPPAVGLSRGAACASRRYPIRRVSVGRTRRSSRRSKSTASRSPACADPWLVIRRKGRRIESRTVRSRRPCRRRSRPSL